MRPSLPPDSPAHRIAHRLSTPPHRDSRCQSITHWARAISPSGPEQYLTRNNNKMLRSSDNACIISHFHATDDLPQPHGVKGAQGLPFLVIATDRTKRHRTTPNATKRRHRKRLQQLPQMARPTPIPSQAEPTSGETSFSGTWSQRPDQGGVPVSLGQVCIPVHTFWEPD